MVIGEREVGNERENEKRNGEKFEYVREKQKEKRNMHRQRKKIKKHESKKGKQ